MAHVKTGFGKVVVARPLSGTELVAHRVDMFKFLMVCMVLFTIVSAFHVWSRCKLIDMNLSIAETNRQLKEAEQEQKRLRLEAASLKTPSRIEAIAKDDLAMGLPTEQQVIVVK